MRIEQLQFFNEIVRTHSISVTSERFFTTPQNVSKSIKALESELGVVLFKRTHHGLVLTQDGERLYHSSQIICNEMNVIGQSFRNHDNDEGSGPSSFSIMSCQPLIPISRRIMNNMLAVKPGLHCTLLSTEAPFLATAERVQRFIGEKVESYDLIFSTLDIFNADTIRSLSDKCTTYSLFREQLCLEVPKDSIWAEKKSISVRSLPAIPMMTHGIDPTELNSFYHGVVARHFNIDVTPNFVTNITHRSIDYLELKKKYAMLRTPYGWESNDVTVLIPIQEKCFIHYAAFVSRLTGNEDAIQKYVFPELRKHFPEIITFM